ncbi:MAG: hypothetical protein K1X64_07965 [Myxococcaceae bacterium]|nr:hypothetical protein [Myxococcaceae bacterium]
MSLSRLARSHPAKSTLPPHTNGADSKLKVSAISTTGITKTAVPALLSDWKQATLEATARGLAAKEMQPDLEVFLSGAQTKHGRPLNEEETDAATGTFFERNAGLLATLSKKHLGTFGNGAQLEKKVTQAVDAIRPQLQNYVDPFTPIARGNPKARAKEVMLWENKGAMVLLDIYSDQPKALVVPKQQMQFPTDQAATPQTLQELARISAHVSDAFMNSEGVKKPAGIWINAPQDLTVKQMHVHVRPDIAPWSKLLKKPKLDGAQAIDLMADPALRKAMDPVFQRLSAQLVKTLGPSQ